jgi:hypothetical protein
METIDRRFGKIEQHLGDMNEGVIATLRHATRA